MIGAGRMGNVYAQHLAQGICDGEVAAVTANGKESARDLADKWGVPSVCNDVEELVLRDDIDAVIVATPSGTHVGIIKAAAANGKHIFCEKPLALTVEECDEAKTAVKTAGVKLQIGFNRRFDSAYMAAKAKIEEGAIGQPVMFKSTQRDPCAVSSSYARREKSGGLITDMGIHEFDQARWLMGSEVVRVFSEGTCLVYPELLEAGDIDNAVVSLQFANGTVGNVDVSRNAVYGYDVVPRLSVVKVHCSSERIYTI